MSAHYDFATVSMKLENGDMVDTPDLRRWIDEATATYKTLLAIPKYSLVVRDLLTEIYKAEGYLRNRA